MTEANLVSIILQGGFAGVLLVVLIMMFRERVKDKEIAHQEKEDDIKSREKHAEALTRLSTVLDDLPGRCSTIQNNCHQTAERLENGVKELEKVL
ncbi:MAG: hypothetical protein WC455_15765 [Dehalococcoidia bacterium]|jgi:hypothetical protein